MGIQQLYNDNLRKLPNEYGDVSVMGVFLFKISPQGSLNDTIGILLKMSKKCLNHKANLTSGIKKSIS